LKQKITAKVSNSNDESKFPENKLNDVFGIGNVIIDEEDKEYIVTLFSFLKDSCQLGFTKAERYSKIMYLSHNIESINSLKRLLKNGLLRSTLTSFISSEQDIDNIEAVIRQLLSDTTNKINSPIIGRIKNKVLVQSVSPFTDSFASMIFFADGMTISTVRPLSESLESESANHISYKDIYTGHYMPPTGRVNVVIKVGDGRRDLAAEESILRFLRDSCIEAVGVIRLIDYSPASVPPYLVLERYGEDIRSFFKSSAAAKHFKRYILDLLRAVDSIHKIGIM